MKEAFQLPFDSAASGGFTIFRIVIKNITPDNNLIHVKLAASIALSPSASLQRIEFPAKAKRASDVNITVFISLSGFQFRHSIYITPSEWAGADHQGAKRSILQTPPSPKTY